MNDLYKLKHKPQKSEKMKFHQGYYYPTNPDKWLTKIIVYRSSWEAKFCRWCDVNPNVIKVASEPIAIPYLNPIANLEYNMKQGLDILDPHNWKISNYYTDFWIEIADETKPDGKRRIFIEIKPYAQTQCPKPLTESATLKEHKAYNKAALTYLQNKSKWDAAAKFCGERGAEFMVITEKTLEKLVGDVNNY